MRLFVVLLALGLGFVLRVEGGDVSVSFEAEEGFEEGALKPSATWTQESETVAMIDRSIQASGSQSLRLEQGVVVFQPTAIPDSEIRFVDLVIKPIAQSAGSVEVAISGFGSSLGFVRDGSGEIHVAAVNGQNPAKLIALEKQTDQSGLFGEWLRLSIRQNITAKKWDLFIDGELKAIDLEMDEEDLDKATLFGTDSRPTWIDDIRLLAENPLFGDKDKDGMPDAVEFASGLNSYADDRAGDLDADGVSNIEESLNGTSSAAPGMLVSNTILYVDNLNGNDGNSGKRSYNIAGEGPMESIKAAIEAAQDGDAIIIMPGQGVYEEGSRGISGKRITIRSVSPVTIK